MKNKEMQARTGLRIIAAIIVSGVLLFSFTGCGKEEVTQEPVAMETVVEMASEEVGAISNGLIDETNDLGIGQEEAITEEYTIAFYDADNEDITVESGTMVTVPEYERQRLINLLPTVFEDFTETNEDFEILSTVDNADGSKTYHVAFASNELSNNVTTQYSVDKETGLAKALFVYQCPDEIEVPAENLGLTFEITVQTDGTVTTDKILDLFGNEVNNIEVYAGNCVGWSLSKWAIDFDFEFGSEVSVQQNLDLYPVMDLSNAATEGEDLTKGVWINSYNGTAIRMITEYEGTKVDENYQVKDGQLVSLDGSKVVDTETGEVSDAPIDTKKEDSNGSESKEQSSTTGGTGNSSTPTNQGTLSDGSQGEAQGMSPEAAAAKWGIEYLGGSGLDTSGFDHGSGGAGWQLQ